MSTSATSNLWLKEYPFLDRLVGRWNGDVTCLTPVGSGMRKVWYLKVWDTADEEQASTPTNESKNATATTIGDDKSPSLQYRLRCTMPDNTVSQLGLVITPRDDQAGVASVCAPHDPLLRDCDMAMFVDNGDVQANGKGALRVHLRVHEGDALRQLHTLSLNESNTALGVCVQHYTADGTLYSVEGGILHRCSGEERERRVVLGGDGQHNDDNEGQNSPSERVRVEEMAEEE